MFAHIISESVCAVHYYQQFHISFFYECRLEESTITLYSAQRFKSRLIAVAKHNLLMQQVLKFIYPVSYCPCQLILYPLALIEALSYTVRTTAGNPSEIQRLHDLLVIGLKIKAPVCLFQWNKKHNKYDYIKYPLFYYVNRD